MIRCKNQLFSQNKYKIYFLFVFACLFYILERFSLFIIDDYNYLFVDYNNALNLDTVDSLGDIIKSQNLHYLNVNGRYLIHCIVQIFVCFLGIHWFRIAQTIMFSLLCVLTTRIICRTWRFSLSHIAITSLMLFFLLPDMGYTVMGNISGGVNYLWTAVAQSIFLIMLDKFSKISYCKNLTSNTLLFFGGILCGALQESFSIPILGALFICLVINPQRLRGCWSLILGYFIGAFIVVISPGNFVRMAGASEEYVSKVLSRFFRFISRPELLIFPLFLIVCLVKLLCSKLALSFSKSAMYYLGIGISIIFSCFVAFSGDRQMFCAGWFAIIIVLRDLFDTDNRLLNRWLLIVLSVVFVALYPNIYKHRQEVYEARTELEKGIRSSIDGDVVAPKWLHYINNHKSFIDYLWVCRWELTDTHKNRVSFYHSGDDERYKSLIPIAGKDIYDKFYKGVYYMPYYNAVIVSSLNNRVFSSIVYNYGVSGIVGFKRCICGQSKIIENSINKNDLKQTIIYNDKEFHIYYFSDDIKICSIFLK